MTLALSLSSVSCCRMDPSTFRSEVLIFICTKAGRNGFTVVYHQKAFMTFLLFLHQLSKLSPYKLCFFPTPPSVGGRCRQSDIVPPRRPPAWDRLFCPGEVQPSGHLWLEEGRHLERLEPSDRRLHAQQWYELEIQ